MPASLLDWIHEISRFSSSCLEGSDIHFLWAAKLRSHESYIDK